MVRLFAPCAMFSGAALLAHILTGVSLALALVFSAGLLGLAVTIGWSRAKPAARALVRRRAGVGILSGLLATVAYDLSKYGLSQWDPSPYNPFEALRIFGVLLVTSAAPPSLIYVAGAAFHFLNGMSFGVAYSFLFGDKGILAGIVWGLFLELFQLALYPGWLDIRFYQEFAVISAFSHVIYGACLGISCQLFKA